MKFKYFASGSDWIRVCELAACLGKLTESAAELMMSSKLVKWSIQLGEGVAHM